MAVKPITVGEVEAGDIGFVSVEGPSVDELELSETTLLVGRLSDTEGEQPVGQR